MGVAKVRLHGELGQVFGSEYRMAVSSFSEAIHAINIKNRGKLYPWLYERDKSGVKYKIVINNEDFKCDNDLTVLSKDSVSSALVSDLTIKRTIDSIDIVPIIEGADSDVFGIITLVLGVILIATGIGAPAGFQFLGMSAGTLALVGVALLAGGIISLLSKPPQFEDFRDISNSGRTSYLFSGPQNTIGEGGPVPIGYGRLIIGSQTIAASYRIRNVDAGAVIGNPTWDDGSLLNSTISKSVANLGVPSAPLNVIYFNDDGSIILSNTVYLAAAAGSSAYLANEFFHHLNVVSTDLDKILNYKFDYEAGKNFRPPTKPIPGLGTNQLFPNWWTIGINSSSSNSTLLYNFNVSIGAPFFHQVARFYSDLDGEIAVGRGSIDKSTPIPSFYYIFPFNFRYDGGNVNPNAYPWFKYTTSPSPVYVYGFNNDAYCVAKQPGTNNYFIGGVFTSFKWGNNNSATVTGLIKVTLNNASYLIYSTVAGWTNPVIAGGTASIYAITIQSDGKILIGGDFTTVDGTSREKVARLNSDGTLDTSFNAGVMGTGIVYSIVVESNGSILLGGSFSECNASATYAKFCRVTSTGTASDALASSISGGDAEIRTIAIQNLTGAIYIGGSFTTVDGVGRKSLAKINSDFTLNQDFYHGEILNIRRTNQLNRVNKIKIRGGTLGSDYGKIFVGTEYAQKGKEQFVNNGGDMADYFPSALAVFNDPDLI